MIRINWSPFAIMDLAAIREYIAKFNPMAAESVAARILYAVNFLSEHPHLGVHCESTAPEVLRE